MADTSLDDFFAKKDKSKKGKAKLKYTTSETIAKKLEDGGRKTDLPMKSEPKEKLPLSSTNQSSILIPSVPHEQEDDEWKNIEEKETDYSGLRIQALSISEREKEEQEQLKEQQEAELEGTRQGEGGPWKMMPSEEPQQPFPQEKPPVEEAAAPKETGAYKPPAMRGAQPLSQGGGRQRKGGAPLISSEVHFPSLSSVSDPKFTKMSEGDRSFQAVRHGVRSRGEQQSASQLDLENKYSALHQGD